MKYRITILGAGSWGVTIADLLHKKGHQITLWEISKNQAEQLTLKRQLPVLPYIFLADDIAITPHIKEACADAQILIMAVPSMHVRSTLETIKNLPAIKRDNLFMISVTKGIETATGQRISQVITDVLPAFQNRIVALSGPSHAEEVARRIPTAVVAAGTNIELSVKTQNIFMNKYFRVYTNEDIIGVELGGSLKNIIALSCGIADGLMLGDNTKAALMTRGLAEMIRLGTALDAKQETFAGLSGIGDLVVTCTSQHSRNRLFGEKMGQGKSFTQAMNEMVMVAEGVPTTKAVYELAKKLKIDMPITTEVYGILYKRKNPRRAIARLMLRKPKPE
ncbi:MAG: NAD(P)H-dependent glycerol-3-phosphate dehydrogenase [Elusimicrobia bacterium]|nr:NAD(P)H-dependent glycerol-3-phosphate dehydrogenase [Elusimicrobiota bacterium]MBD3411992.1 NAD(P)H-dependent glycerol-3-phosphate dehydrogenase [Elusimicrobiota bacterium]